MPALGQRASLTTLDRFVQRAHARPGHELEVDREAERLREVAQLGEEIEDVGPVVAPRAAQHMAPAELGRCFERG